MSGIMPKKRASEHGLKPGKKAKRRVRVSQQRQLSIPKDFYLALGLTDEAVMEFTGQRSSSGLPHSKKSISLQIFYKT
ncbi:hypothetical protein [Planococcus faecalis]|uniref:hypothetical protein n=1 Tax=Planococcus faecalis TaxID=1598147 RepID=UPI0008D9EFA6|nr:hypothetical protein [Planococcus faecalis]OHX51275.1 hypothetical protein BB777_17635 [Planococcus faecalis]